jgi:hypothetical protein
MKDEIARLESIMQQITALLRAGEPISQKDQALLTSLTWHLLAALHSRRSRDKIESGSPPARPTIPSEGSDPTLPRKNS